jgi:S1-C subfamily serine protease
VALLLVLVGALLFKLFDNVFVPGPDHDPHAAPRAVTARGDLAEDEKTTIALFRAASPSVVHVTSQVETAVNRRATEVQQGTGSGFVWNDQGHVVTNFHVVQNATRVIVTFDTGDVHEARIVGSDADRDLAVLKIDAPRDQLHPIPVGTSGDLLVGQKVFAIGNPFGLDHTLTTGVISGLEREIDSTSGRPIQGVVQTDAAINPGNSGGPLLDSEGRLIGVNTAIVSPSGAYAGIGFAVPVDTVNSVVPQLIRVGYVERPGLGIRMWPEEKVVQLVALGAIDRRGVLVDVVIPGGAAERAGLEGTKRRADGTIFWGDLIVEIDGREIAQSRDLFRVLDDHAVGDKLAVTFLRDGDPRNVTVTLQSLPPSED